MLNNEANAYIMAFKVCKHLDVPSGVVDELGTAAIFETCENKFEDDVHQSHKDGKVNINGEEVVDPRFMFHDPNICQVITEDNFEPNL